MSRGLRTLLDRFNFEACYRISDGASCYIARCRHCSAGWMPAKDARDANELIAHALKHGVDIHRRRRVNRPVQRRVVVRVGDRIVYVTTQHVSAARAARDRELPATVEVVYESSGSHDLSPGEALANQSPPSSDAAHEELRVVKHWVQ